MRKGNVFIVSVLICLNLLTDDMEDSSGDVANDKLCRNPSKTHCERPAL